MIALPTLAIFDNPQVCFLTHSRGAIIVRKVLKDNVSNPTLQRRIDKVITLCGPNQGSEILNAVYGPINTLETVANSCFCGFCKLLNGQNLMEVGPVTTRLQGKETTNLSDSLLSLRIEI
jgi:triacylglycerol esterase/lipase EstA (alpha/beta hydrolase family)